MKKLSWHSFAVGTATVLAVLTLLMAGSATQAFAGTITGRVSVAGGRDNADVLVYIASVPGQFSPQGAATIDQRNLRFEPHVLPVVVGTTVNFLNSDGVQHNTFTPSPAGDFFNLGTWPKGEARTYTFTKMGKVELLCNVHHEMHAFILVLQNPYFAVTDKEGNYRIDGVPAGSYTLKVWHERATAPPYPTHVSNGSLVVNFDLAAR